VDGRELMKRGRVRSRRSFCTSVSVHIVAHSQLVPALRLRARAPCLRGFRCSLFDTTFPHLVGAVLPTPRSRPRAPSLPARWESHIKAVPTTTACDSSDRVKDDRPAYRPSLRLPVSSFLFLSSRAGTIARQPRIRRPCRRTDVLMYAWTVAVSADGCGY
jgi:hypothetical protein